MADPKVTANLLETRAGDDVISELTFVKQLAVVGTHLKRKDGRLQNAIVIAIGCGTHTHNYAFGMRGARELADAIYNVQLQSPRGENILSDDEPVDLGEISL